MLFWVRHLRGRRRAGHETARLGARRVAFSAANASVTVRFIVDQFPADGRLRGEPGVSYLVTAGRHRILFDLGFNPRKTDPSPLQANLRALGLAEGKLDGVFISHNHLDHVGGFSHQRAREPALGQLPRTSLAGAPVWTPIPMRGPDGPTSFIDGPAELLPGVASTGPLPAHLYFLGMIREQALLAPVEGKGLVLVTGCGHPGIVGMVRFAREVTGVPVFAVVGGLHLVCTHGRTRLQKHLGAGHPPWAFPREGDVRRIAADLKALGVSRIAPSAHDTCDTALAILRGEFGDGYVEVNVGGECRFPSAAPAERGERPDDGRVSEGRQPAGRDCSAGEGVVHR
jgi:7,8-dihydropterin-6-yl-methyl-4-(beta-D-ribofuranosyl)aminobenzene 5'-phosphate synthase